MRALPAAVTAHLAQRKGLLVHALIWLTAKDRTTSAAESLGLWTGPDHQEIVVGGEARTYYGAGPILGLSPFVSQAQGHEQTWQLQVSSLHEQVVEALRVYDARLAPIEVHSWYLDPATHLPLADPVREFRGTVMELDLPTPPIGGEATATITAVPDAWRLTRGLTTRRSDAALRKRAAGDGFRQYNTLSGSVQVAWGEKIKGPDGKTGPEPMKFSYNSDR